jgi:hypothetical protein
MPSTRARNRLVSQRDACAALGVCRLTFFRRWASIFSDSRDPADRKRGVPRKVREDELNVALNDGRLAVLNYRRLVGRTKK